MHEVTIDAIDVLCAQPTCDLSAIAKFLVSTVITETAASSSKMIYNVSSGTLNPTIRYRTLLRLLH